MKRIQKYLAFPSPSVFLEVFSGSLRSRPPNNAPIVSCCLRFHVFWLSISCWISFILHIETELFVVNLCKSTTKLSSTSPRMSLLREPERKRKKKCLSAGIHVHKNTNTYLMNNSNRPVLSIKCVCPFPIRALIFNVFLCGYVCIPWWWGQAERCCVYIFEMCCDARAVYFRTGIFNRIGCLH